MAENGTYSVPEYAKSRKLNPSTIYKAIKNGRLSLTDGKKIDPEVADEVFRLRGNQKNGDWSKARAIHEGYKAKMAKVEYEKMVGQLIERQVVNETMAKCAELMVRDIEQFASHAEEIMAISQKGDVRAVRKRIKELTDDLRKTIASHLRASATN